MEEMITISLPATLYQQLQRSAELAQKSPDSIVAQSLTHTLPPLLDDIPQRYQADVYPLLQMDVAELRHEAEQVFPLAQWTQYEWLLEQKKVRQLTETESQQLDSLRYKADLLTLRKGYAAVLLKRRGYHLPPFEAVG